MRRTPMKRTGWARSSTTAPATVKKPRTMGLWPARLPFYGVDA
jgi:hypothetical protein